MYNVTIELIMQTTGKLLVLFEPLHYLFSGPFRTFGIKIYICSIASNIRSIRGVVTFFLYHIELEMA